MTYNRNPQPVVKDPQRLAVLDSLGLLDSPAEAAFDRLTRLASYIIGAPISLVSLIDADRQFFKSQFGLPDPVAQARETPLSHSFCQHVVADDTPLIVSDARGVSFLKDNLAIPDLDVIAYLGIPLSTSDGVSLGSFCVIDNEPREWSDHEIEIMHELAMSVMTEIELRAQIKAREAAEEALHNRNRKLRRVTLFCNSTLEHMQTSIEHGGNLEEVYAYVREARTELERLD
jgi:GAF domain-containing protein